MNSPKSITSKLKPYFIISLIIFMIVHLVLFNINAAEWGDSYRILRSAEELRMGNPYPDDEKRPPLLSMILSLRPDSISPVTFGRLTIFLFSLGSFILFHELLKQYFSSEKYRLIGLMLFIFNPAFLYWSIRIMADVPFAFFVLLGFFILNKLRSSEKNIYALFVGLISGFSILMRFEGYILSASLGLGLVFRSYSDIKDLFMTPISFVEKNIKKSLLFFTGLLSLLVPFVLYRNPFSSSYFEEPSGRSYDLNMVLIYIASFIFLFGITSSAAFCLTNIKHKINFINQNIGIALFLGMELLLILGWPAAIPRLFVAVVPLLIIFLVDSIKKHFEEDSGLTFVVLTVGLWFLYMVVQYYLGLQFLVMTRKLILLIFTLQIPVMYAAFKRKINLFIFFTALSALVWAFLVIYMHKDIFISVKSAAEYAVTNYEGKFCYNDVSSVSRWYFNYQSDRDVTGVYCDMDSGERLNEGLLIDKGVDYILLTNEHNLGLEIDFEKRSYLKVLKEFRYNVNGSEFVTYLASYEKE